MKKPPKLELSPEVRAWIDSEVAEQLERYRQIVDEMDGIGSDRERWIEEFLARIQDRGYNVHADILRKIRPDEIPERPDRKLRVVF